MLMGTGIIWKSSHVHWLRKRRDCCVCVVMEAIGNIGTYWKLQVYSEWHYHYETEGPAFTNSEFIF